MKRNCDNCAKEYNADSRNLKRGWGLCCSKSCAAQKREKSKPGYSAEKAALNNIKREFWVKFKTVEDYDVIDGVAYDEFGEPVYNLNQ